MLGYMTAKTAISHGFTHNGSMYGIPIYTTDPEVSFPMISAKHVVMEYVLDFAEIVYQCMGLFGSTIIKVKNKL